MIKAVALTQDSIDAVAASMRAWIDWEIESTANAEAAPGGSRHLAYLANYRRDNVTTRQRAIDGDLLYVLRDFANSELLVASY